MDVPLTPGNPPRPVVLEGRTVRVRPLDVDRDGAALFAEMAGEGERIYRYLPIEPPVSPQALAAQLAGWQAHPATLQFLFEDIESGRPAGTSSYMRIAPEHRALEVGFVVMAPWAQRSTLASEAQYLLARHVFDDLGYRRYEWKCDDRNAASKAAAERFGFTFEGTFRNHMIVKGENRDTTWFAMTDAQWPAVNDAFERWLGPENFDSDGRQRIPLAALRRA